MNCADSFWSCREMNNYRTGECMVVLVCKKDYIAEPNGYNIPITVQ